MFERGRRWAAPTLVAALAALAGACGDDEGTGAAASGGKADGKIAFLLPESKTAQYETQDRPWFFRNVKRLCPECEVLYSNAEQDAQKQQQQAEAALVNGADVLVLDPVDSASSASIAAQAKSRGVPVIAYDRQILDADIDYHVSFDNEAVGRLQGEWLAEQLEPGATVVAIHGSPTDDNARLFKRGAKVAMEAGGLRLAKEFDTPDWSPDKAQREMEQAITALGKGEIDGVYAANDGTAGGAIAAMTNAGVDPLPPVTGQDAEIAALQRVLAGKQGMTVYRSIKQQSLAAVQLALALLRGEDPPAGLKLVPVDNGAEQVPSVLFDPVAVTAENLADTVIADGYWKAQDICTAEYADACAKAGIT